MPEHVYRVATRGSTLALAQTGAVVERLRALSPGRKFEVVTIKTTGDAAADGRREPLGTGVFVREIEEALLAGEADLAVHSLKDLPTELAPGLTIAAIPERTDPRDALISKTGARLDELPAGAVVGTGSGRRAAQVLACRPDLRVEPIRGNLETRLAKLVGKRASDVAYDAIIVAVAGCRRLRLENRITEVISSHTMLPAPGQGALAVEVRDDNAGILDMARALDDDSARAATTAERAFLRALGGGCRTPIGALAEIAHCSFILRGRICTPDGRRLITGTNEGPPGEAAQVGTTLAETLLNSGGRLLLGQKPAV